MKIFIRKLYLILLSVCLSNTILLAQRNYATNHQEGSSGVLCANCIVDNPENAADVNPSSFSTINIVLGVDLSGNGVQTYQELIFSEPAVSAGTPVHLKLGTGDKLLSLQALGAVFVRPYNGTTPAGPAVAVSTLVTALSNNNQVEVVLNPTQLYDRVRVTLDGGIAGALTNIYLYDAYYNGNGPVPCNSAIDELHGISSALLGTGLNVGGVSNPQLAIDGNISTASTLNAGVALAGAFAQQTVIYQAPSMAGDSIRLTLTIPQELIDAGVLSRITVSTANGSANNNDSRFLNSSLLTVNLLDLTSNRRKIVVAFVPANIFDRVQLKLGGGLANVLSTLDLFEARKMIPSPVVTYNGGAITNIQICSGTAATLTATAVANTVFNWYTSPTGGTPIFTGATFITPLLTAKTTYYAEAMQNGCTDASQRIPVTVNILPLPSAPVIANASVTICAGQKATFTAIPTMGVTINWYAAATGGTTVFTGNAFTTGNLTQNATYYVEALDINGCVSSARAQVSVIVQPLPLVPVVTLAMVIVNPSQTNTLTITDAQAGVAYNWYTVSAGGTIIYTGTAFTTPPLSNTATYYIEAVGGNCMLPSRTSVIVNVNSAPQVTVSPPTQNVSSGQTATLTASSTTVGASFNWYTTLTGSTPVFIGATFTTPPITAKAIYYAEALDPVTGAASTTRAMGVITVNGPVPDVAITPSAQSVNSGQTATFTATSTTPGSIFNWYTAPTGGTPIFTGATFTTPQITDKTTYYAEAADPVTGTVSTTRATGTVTINGTAPGVMVTPTTQSVNSGQTVVFTASSTTPNATFNWYTAPKGGTLIFTGAVFTTPPVTAKTTYYAEAVDPATGTASTARATGMVTLNGASPGIIVMPPTQQVNAGQSAVFTASSPTPGTLFNWYTTPTGGIPIFTGATFTTPPVTSNTTYYVEAVDPATGSASSMRATGVVTLPPPDVTVTPSTRIVNSGQTTTLTASSTTPGATFRWYTTLTGNTPVFIGATFTTPPVTANTTYYAEAVNPATGASSNSRATGTVTLNPIPDITVTPPVQVIIAGQTTTFVAASSTSGAVFNWYTTSTGGMPIFTGPVFLTPQLAINTIYYTEAVDPATKAVSSARATATVNVNTNTDVYIPSAFSPNGDGRNDKLLMYGASISQSSMYIYNQWGQLLFRSDNINNGWDGTWKGVEQPVGVYVYYVKVILTNNTVISKKGTITLIR